MRKAMPIIIYLIVSNLYILFANTPYIFRQMKTPVDARYTWVQMYPIDYYLYLTAINQGRNGDWLFDHPYTSERHFKPSIIYIYYILTGKIAGVLNLFTPYAYLMVKIISAELLVLSAYFLATEIFGKRGGFQSSLLFLAVNPLTEKFIGQPLGFIFSPWWFGLNAFERLDQLPHHMFGQGMLILSTLFLLRYLRTFRVREIISASVSVFLQGIVFPPTIAVSAGVAAALMIFQILRKSFRMRRITLDGIWGFVPFIAASGISFFLVKSQEKLGFPWDLWTPFEMSRWNVMEFTFNSVMLKTLIPLILILAVNIIPAIKKHDRHRLIMLVWGSVPMILLPFADLFKIPKIRLVQSLPFLPYAFLSFFALRYLKGKLFYAAFFLFLAINISLSVPQYLKKTDYYRNVPGDYFPKAKLEALSFMDKMLPRRSTVLSYEYDGIAIPSFTSHYVYFGQLSHTYDFFAKKEKTIEFFRQGYEEQEAWEFLKDNHIGYVYMSNFEKEIAGGQLGYSFLDKIFENGEVVLYRVRS